MTVSIDPAYIKNDWVQLSLTLNLADKTVRIYQNDTLLTEYVDSDMFEALDNNLTVIVGKSRDDDKYFKGLIDNCTVYDTVLETNEIGSLYYDLNHMKLGLNTWSHITGNYSSINNQVSTYINGELVYKKTYLPPNVTNSNNIDIGKGFSGEISELVIAERPFYESEISYLSTDVMRFDELFPLLSLDIQERNTTQLSDVSGLNNHGTVTGTPIYVHGYKRGTYAVRLTAEQDIQIDNSLITDYDFNNFLLKISVRVSSLPSEIQLIHSNEFTISMTASALKLVVGGDTVSLDIGTLENDTFIQLMVQVSLVKAKLIVFRKDTGNKYETAFNHTIPKITSALTCCGTNFEGDLQDLDISLGYGIENNTFEQTMYSVYQNDFTIPPVPFSDMTVHNMVTNDGVISGTTDGAENYAEYSVSLPIFLQVEIAPPASTQSLKYTFDWQMTNGNTTANLNQLHCFDASGVFVDYTLEVFVTGVVVDPVPYSGTDYWLTYTTHSHISTLNSEPTRLFSITAESEVATMEFRWYREKYAPDVWIYQGDAGNLNLVGTMNSGRGNIETLDFINTATITAPGAGNHLSLVLGRNIESSSTILEHTWTTGLSAKSIVFDNTTYDVGDVIDLDIITDGPDPNFNNMINIMFGLTSSTEGSDTTTIPTSWSEYNSCTIKQQVANGVQIYRGDMTSSNRFYARDLGRANPYYINHYVRMTIISDSQINYAFYTDSTRTTLHTEDPGRTIDKTISLPAYLFFSPERADTGYANYSGNSISVIKKGANPDLGFGIENGSLYLNIQGKQAYSSSLISSESVDVPIALFMDDLHLIYYLYGEEVTRVSRTVDSVLWDDVASDVVCRLVTNSSSGGFKNFQVLDKNIYSTMPPHTIVSSSLFDYIGTIHLKYDIDTDADGNSDKLNFVSTQGGSTAARHILSKNTYTLPLYVECIVKPGNVVANAFGLHVFRLSTNTVVNLHTVGDVNGMVFGIFNNNYYYSQSGSVYTDTSSVANTVIGVEYKLAIYATEEHILLYHNNNLVTTISASTDSTFWDNYVSEGGKIGFYSNDAGDTSMRSFVTLNYNPKATTSAVAFSDILHYTTDQLYYNYNVSHFDRIAYNSASNHTDIVGKMHTISKQSYKLPLFLECELKTSNSFVGLHLFSIDKLQPTESEIDAEMDGIIWGTGKNTNELYYKICDDVSTSSSTADPFLQYFTKFAIYVDDVKIRLYQDGILKKTVRKSENALFWNNLSYDQMGYFGIYGESGGSQFRNLVIASRDLYYRPDVSPVHIESYVKTVERIITIADYDFNQSSGTVVNSLSNGTNGVLNQGTGSYPTRQSPSYFENGMSMKFERSGWIDIMSDASWSDLSNLSLSVWIKPTLDGSENMLIEANKYRIGINGAGNLFFSVGNETEMTTTVVKTVTFATMDGSNVYFVDGTQETTLDLIEGNTYVFDWSAATVHPLRFSETLDGPNGGGSEYTSGVTVDSVASTTTIVIDTNTPRQFYFYCEYHSGMGAAINVNTNPNSNFERLVCTNYTLTTEYWVNIGITIDSFNKKIAFYSNNQLQSYHTVLSDMTNHLISGTDVVKVGNGFLGSMDSFQLFKGVVSQLVLSENNKVPSQPVIQKLPTSRYTHVAAVYESSKNMITTYVDGEYNVCYENYLQDYRTIGTNDSNINIAFNDDNKFFDGLLDDIRIYDKSLNEAQIKSIYDSYHKEVWITDFNFNYSNKVYSVVGREPVNIPANFPVDTYIIATLDDVFQTEEQLINLVQTIVSVNEVNPYRKITYTTTGSTTEEIQYSYSPITFSYYYDSITTTDSISNIDSFTELKFHLITKSYDGTYLFMSKVIER